MLEKLREIRKNRKISADEMCHVLGLSTKAAYYKKESGTIRFSLEDAKKISDFFKMPVEDIFFGDEVSNLDTKTEKAS